MYSILSQIHPKLDMAEAEQMLKMERMQQNCSCIDFAMYYINLQNESVNVLDSIAYLVVDVQ